jgi:hypothetical protein
MYQCKTARRRARRVLLFFSQRGCHLLWEDTVPGRETVELLQVWSVRRGLSGVLKHCRFGVLVSLRMPVVHPMLATELELGWQSGLSATICVRQICVSLCKGHWLWMPLTRGSDGFPFEHCYVLAGLHRC